MRCATFAAYVEYRVAAMPLETIEATIQATEAEVTRIEGLFADPDFYKNHGDQWEELDGQLVAAKEKVQTLYRRWEELDKLKALSI